MSQVKSDHSSLGLNNYLPVPAGWYWVFLWLGIQGLRGAALTVLPSLPQTLPQTSPLLTPKDCFMAPALPLNPISLLLTSFSSCILDSDSSSPFKHKFLCRRLLLSATLVPHAFIVVLFIQSYCLLSSLLSLFGLPPGGEPLYGQGLAHHEHSGTSIVFTSSVPTILLLAWSQTLAVQGHLLGASLACCLPLEHLSPGFALWATGFLGLLV